MKPGVGNKSLDLIRRTYAKQMLAAVGASGDARLERAFAATPREAFLGPGPWLVTHGGPYTRVSADPTLLYQDVLVALKEDKRINNGSPSLHANWLYAAHVKAGERVVHIGAGGGYYTAILSRLVGSLGRVTAVEFDPDLAAAARAHLAEYRNVTVVQGDGAGWPQEPVDLVYVNFAVDRPAPPWLEWLKPGGRLIFPLGTIARRLGGPSYGVGLLIERIGDDGVYAAKSLGGAYFVRAEGDARLLAEGDEREALLSAFERGGFDAVKSLRWRVAPSAEHALFVGEGWSLGADAPGRG
jgi:protein-L-isoaspartate(D-aspartate) O-methyltransferase